MSLKNIQLPDFVLGNLYKQFLIEGETVPAPKEELPAKTNTAAAGTKAAAGYKILGSNSRNIAMIVQFPGDAFLPDHHLQFLVRMLEACKLHLGDVAIVNNAGSLVDIEALKQQLQPRQVFLFGVEPGSIKLPFSFPHFKEQEHGGCVYLYTPPLDELNQDSEEGKLLKSKLWVCLRKMFGV